MGLFGKKKKDQSVENAESQTTGATVAPVNQDDSELQTLLNEFREMRAGMTGQRDNQDETHDVESLSESGEAYKVSADESESIERFLSGEEEAEELEESIEDEEIDDFEDAEMVDDESSDEEQVDEEYLIEEDEEIVDEEDGTREVQEIEEFEESEDSLDLQEDTIEEFEQVPELDEEIIENEELSSDKVDIEPDIEEDIIEEDSQHDIVETEPVEVEVNVVEPTPVVEELIEEQPTPVVAPEVDAVTNEELDKKFDEFENRLLEKLMAQFQNMGGMVAAAPAPVINASPTSADDQELVISSDRGKLVINGYKFTGDVVMFTPIESVRKATWEEVVRRKGHCTYHLTTSGNGGWFIKKSNAPNPYAYIQKKEEAEELARIYASREKAELKIHNAKGVIEKSLSFGREKLRG